MVDINEVAENICMIDNHLYSIPKFGSVYLLNEERKALVETGPTTSARAVIDGVKSLGVKPEDIAYAALYLASDEAAMLTGSSINVDGGRAI